MSGGNAADSSQKTVGTRNVNCGRGDSDYTTIPEENVHEGSRYVTRFFYNSAVKPKEVTNLMARKAKNVTATFPERIKTRIFGRSTRFAFDQEPSVEALKCSSNSKHGEQFTISHPVVQPQSLRFNGSPDIIRSNECTQKDSCHELGQGLNPKHALDQGLNLSSNHASGTSHRAQST